MAGTAGWKFAEIVDIAQYSLYIEDVVCIYILLTGTHFLRNEYHMTPDQGQGGDEHGSSCSMLTGTHLKISYFLLC